MVFHLVVPISRKIVFDKIDDERLIDKMNPIQINFHKV